MIDFIGWIGGIFLSVCALPQAIKVFKEKHADGTSHGMLMLWFFGEVFTLIYVCCEKWSPPLILNYSLNIVFMSVILYYKYFYKDNAKTKV